MRFISVFLCLLYAAAAFGQHVWWEPEAPVVGQPFSIYYDSRIGPLGPNVAQLWLHWGVVPNGGGWSAPPESIWPPGSHISPDGYACQSPMNEGVDTVWSVPIDPDTSIRHLAFVFTDMANNWDNNNNQNWRIDFVTGDVVAWWSPEEPVPGDLVTIFYNTIPGTLPDGAQNVLLHWGINELYFGIWQVPPESMWPPGTVSFGDGHAVETPMTSLGSGIWSLAIQTNDTTFTLHFVTRSGESWDGNAGANWNIILEEPPPPVFAHHTFAYDPRSAFVGYFGAISSASVAGTFNGWSATHDPLQGPNENGVWMQELTIPAGTHEYKFVLNGSNWQNDPDNPNFEPSGYHNNVMNAVLDTMPQIYHLFPSEGEIYRGASAQISAWAKVRRGDRGPGLQGVPTVTWDDAPVTSTWYAGSESLAVAPINALPGRHVIAVSATDSAGRTSINTTTVAVIDSEYGFYAIDPEGDDFGPGTYVDPYAVDGEADLLAFSINEAANGDSLAFEIELAAISQRTRVAVHVMSDIAPPYAPTAAFNLEMDFPDWNGRGVAFVLGDTSQGISSPAALNTLYLSRVPLSYGAEIELDPQAYADGRFVFRLARADLEAVMGSYQSQWFYACCAFLANPADGDAYEVDSLTGGSDAIGEPDIYDALFWPPRLQHVMLRNWSGNRTATFDAARRGFAAIYPDSIGPNVLHSGPVVRILTKGTHVAPTILPDKELTCTFHSDTTLLALNLYQNDNPPTSLPMTDDTFSVDVTLEEGVNLFWLEGIDANADTGRSAQTVFELVVNHQPDPVIAPRVETGEGVLDGSGSTDPDSDNLTFIWTADTANPEEVTIINPNASIASFALPTTLGEYYFQLDLSEPVGQGSTGRTLFTIYPDSAHAFDWNESAQNVRDGIIYEIYPRSYSANAQLSAITADIERIQGLGVSYIYLMPIFEGPSGHGYEITDYYSIEEDYGTEEDLRDLIEAAHAHGMRVMLDMVINHSSIQHPFMQDAMRYGRYSQYWDYYDRDANGNYTYYYDWASLPNLNYDNPDVEDYFIDVAKYWVEEFGVHGYRCDVAWGPQSRTPTFWPKWRSALKKIRPDVLLLGEMDAIVFNNFDHRFDAAYDWALHHAGIENFANMFQQGIPNINNLHTVITNYGYNYPAYKFPYRFLEDHDHGRYISYNTVEQTKLAAILLFTINGVPLIYAGQEVGETSQRELIDWAGGPPGFSHFYYRLCQLRNQFPATRSSFVERLTNNQSSIVYSYMRRKTNNLPILVALNMAPNSQVVTVTVPTTELGLHPDSTYYLSELLTSTYIQRTGSELQSVVTSLSAYQARVWTIAREPVQLAAPEPPQELPKVFSLGQNYPNPFNPVCTVPFELPSRSRVTIAIFNLLGQRVRVLTDAVYPAGIHRVAWDGHNDLDAPVTSGIYFYQIRAGDFVAARKMILLR
jgi:glycosidase